MRFTVMVLIAGLLPAGIDAQQRQRPEYLNSSPVYSPDGARIAFVSSRDGRGELYLVNADGTGERRLTNSSESKGMPLWTRDGRALTYRSGNGRNPEQFIIDVESGIVERLVRDDARQDANGQGTHIVSRGTWPRSSLALIGNGREVAISPPDGIAFWPRWSPTGDRAAFTYLEPSRSNPEESRMWLAVVDAHGRGFRKVTPDSIRAETPAWFPDGSRLAFQAATNGNYDIWTVDLATGAVTRLTDGPQLEETPSVSPDGRTIVFQSDRDGKVDLWLMDFDGGNIRRLLER